MKHNLMESFNLEIKPGLVGLIQRMNLASEPTMIENLSILHASIIAGLIQKTRQEKGAETLQNLLEVGNHDGEILNQLPEIVENEAKLSDLRIAGNTLLSFVFDKGLNTSFEKIQKFLAQKYQIDADELLEVSQLAVPFSIGLLGRVVREEQLDPSQIAHLLHQHEPLIIEKYSGLAQLMGLAPTTNQQVESAGPERLSASSPAESQSKVIREKGEEDDRKEREVFFRALWPWITLLLVSGLALYILKNFWNGTSEPIPAPMDTMVVEDSLFADEDSLVTLEDSIIAEPDNLATTPVEVPTVKEETRPLDSVLNYLNIHQTIGDTIRFENSIISFQDSTSTLTISANNDLTGLIAILKAHSTVNVGIEMTYDSAFYKNHAPIIQERVNNLSNYFNAFGLDNSRYSIQSIIADHHPAPTSENTDPQESTPTRDSQIEISFYNR